MMIMAVVHLIPSSFRLVFETAIGPSITILIKVIINLKCNFENK